MKIYTLIADTDSYSGNFEREMSTYATGLIFPRGRRFAQIEEFPVGLREWWEENNIELPLEHHEWDEGCSILPTEGVFNNGRGTHYQDSDFEKLKSECFMEMKWPAYQSVGIFSRTVIPSVIFEQTRKRILDFPKIYQHYNASNGTMNEFVREPRPLIKILNVRIEVK